MIKRLNPHISVDCTIFGFDGSSLRILLIKRNHLPESTENIFKLPGSLVFDDEDINDAASRVLFELTGLTNLFLQQFQAFGAPERLSNKEDLDWLQKFTNLEIKRVVTVAFYSLIKIDSSIVDERYEWFDVNKLPVLTFDHKDIIDKALDRIRKEFIHEPIEFELLPKRFTIRQLQNLHEIIYNEKLDSRNFRKKLAKQEYIIAVNEKEKGVAHKPAQLYKFDKKIYMKTKDII